MRKLVLVPSQAGYGVGFGNEVLEAQLSGGPSRRRRDFIGAVATVAVGWNVPPEAFQYLQAFYRTATKNGSEPFLIDLILDGPMPTEYTASFIGGSYQIVGVRGLETSVSAQLEVKPLPIHEDDDEAIMLAYELFGEGVGGTFDALTILMNYTAPASIPG